MGAIEGSSEREKKREIRIERDAQTDAGVGEKAREQARKRQAVVSADKCSRQKEWKQRKQKEVKVDKKWEMNEAPEPAATQCLQQSPTIVPYSAAKRYHGTLELGGLRDSAPAYSPCRSQLLGWSGSSMSCCRKRRDVQGLG